MTRHSSSADTYGRFDMSVHENVLHAKVFGSLDPASMNASTNILVPLVKEINGPWASLIDYREWELYSERYEKADRARFQSLQLWYSGSEFRCAKSGES